MENENKNKKTILPIIGLVVVGALVLLLGTYAYWQVTRKQTNRNLVGSACLDITFSNETGDINLEKMWPTSDADGSKLVPYTFTLTNTCPDELVAYTVALEEIKDDSEEPITYPDEYLSDSNLKIKFDTLAPVKISTLDNMTNDNEQDYEIYKTKKIINRKLAGGESRTHSVRIWLDANAPQSEMNKFFLSKIKIIAGQGIEEECYAVNQEGLLYSYDPDCGKSATIPATVDGKQVKTIASDAFKQTTTSVVYHYKRSDNTEVSSASALPFQQCGTEGIDKDCTVDMSIALSDKLLPAFLDQSLLPSVLPTVTTDDIYFIQYNDDLTATQINALKSSLWSLTSFDQMGLSFDYNDLELYEYGTDTLPPEGNGRLEWYAAASYSSGSWIGAYLGSKETDGSTTTVSGLAINNLDLSQATHLTKIEDRAFSNAPSMNSNILISSETLDTQAINNSIATGLTSLTFGNNTNSIEFGYASFAKSNLNNLTIYSNYHMPRVGAYTDSDVENIDGEDSSTYSSYILDKNDPNSYYALTYGAFGGSTIGTLTINNVENTFNPSTGQMLVWARYCLNENCAIQPTPIISSLFGSTGSEIVGSSSTITTLNMDNSINTIDIGAFVGTTIGTINFPTSLTTIGRNAFYDQTGTGTITLPSGVTTIKTDAFYSFRGTIKVPTQTLVDSKSTWAPSATVQLSS